MDQYFSNNPNIASDPKTLVSTLRGHRFMFTTDNGVFSKNDIDFGSRVLIETFREPKLNGSLLDVGCGYQSEGFISS